MSSSIKSARTLLPGSGKPHECGICGRRLVDKRSLRQHVAAAHPTPADEICLTSPICTEVHS